MPDLNRMLQELEADSAKFCATYKNRQRNFVGVASEYVKYARSSVHKCSCTTHTLKHYVEPLLNDHGRAVFRCKGCQEVFSTGSSNIASLVYPSSVTLVDCEET